jgi:hypothetical protein
MTDPLQKVLAAESNARARIEKAQETLESSLRAARVQATHIRERNEQRTRVAVESIERKQAAETEREIEYLEQNAEHQLQIDDDSAEARLEALVRRHVAALWPDDG